MKKYIILGASICCALSAEVSIDFVDELPTTIKTVMQTWAEHNKVFVQSLLAHEVRLSDYAMKQRDNMALIEKKLLHNYGRYNYIFEIPELPGYILKISCLTCRFANILMANDYRPAYFGDESAEGRLKICQTLTVVPTYQTASSWNTYHLYDQLAKKNSLKYVRLPKTFIFKLVDSESIHDQNSIVIQEKIALLDEDDENQLCKTMTDEQIKELVMVIGACGLWNIKSNIKFDNEGHIVIVSLEQPDISNPVKGFVQHNPYQFLNDVQQGLGELSEIFENDEHRQQVIQDFADPIVASLYDKAYAHPA